MSPEQQPQPQSPEREQESITPVFDLKQLSAEAIVILNQLIGREAARLGKAFVRAGYTASVDNPEAAEAKRWLSAATELDEAYGRDLEGSLIDDDIDKAREAILMLAASDDVEDRVVAAAALGPLLKREYEVGTTQHAASEADLLIQLLNDPAEPEYMDTASSAMSHALEEGWLPPDVAERFRQELED